MNINNELISRKALSNKVVYNLTPFTLLDYPHKTACIIWFAGCNMRCLYCYNPDIVLGKGKLDFQTVIDFLKSRKGLLDGVVFSGGECTMHKDLITLIKEVKALGFKVKIDTNGSRPNVLQQLINDQLIDYVALDFKSLPDSFNHITQSDLFLEFEQSLSLLMTSSIAFELRTTVHSELINSFELEKMILFLETKNFEGNYYVQHFKNNTPTIGQPGFSSIDAKYENFSCSKIKVIFRS